VRVASPTPDYRLKLACNMGIDQILRKSNMYDTKLMYRAIESRNLEFERILIMYDTKKNKAANSFGHGV
jgi:hypothetical protein